LQICLVLAHDLRMLSRWRRWGRLNADDPPTDLVAEQVDDGEPPSRNGGDGTTAVPAHSNEESYEDHGEELFAIIDETGEGWGFDLDPGTVMKPLAITSAALFGFGILAGIPAGLALGRSEDAAGPEHLGKPKPRPTVGSALFALRAFLYGTLLCGTCGAAAAYATAYYYDVWTWRDFGAVMRRVVPKRRESIDNALSPLLNRMRRSASETLPGPMNTARDRFGDSRLGIYIRGGIEKAVTVTDTGHPTEPSEVQRKDVKP
jgi:hypothetical protein